SKGRAEQRASHIDRATADLVGKPGEEHDREDFCRVAQHHGADRRPAWHVQCVDHIGQAEYGEEVAKTILGKTGADHDKEVARMAPQRLDRRRLQGGRLSPTAAKTGVSWTLARM